MIKVIKEKSMALLKLIVILRNMVKIFTRHEYLPRYTAVAPD